MKSLVTKGRGQPLVTFVTRSTRPDRDRVIVNAVNHSAVHTRRRGTPSRSDRNMATLESDKGGVPVMNRRLPSSSACSIACPRRGLIGSTLGVILIGGQTVHRTT